MYSTGRKELFKIVNISTLIHNQNKNENNSRCTYRIQYNCIALTHVHNTYHTFQMQSKRNGLTTPTKCSMYLQNLHCDYYYYRIHTVFETNSM